MDTVLSHLTMFAAGAFAIWREVAPWLLAGLIIAGVLKAFFPTHLLSRWLGGRGVGPVFKAAIIGTPLPLCSCSVLPTAIQLHRSGASKGATTAFLVATPENGADSIALSYVLLGPAMTIIRPVAAILSAVATGLLADYVARRDDAGPNASPAVHADTACCGPNPCQAAVRGEPSTDSAPRTGAWRVVSAAVVDLLDDIAGWLAVGIAVAAALEMLVPAEALVGFGSGLLPMLAIAMISVPMYICATAGTPIAASMLIAGMSPGTVLVFLLAGPATNVASAAILWRELGNRVTAAYLAGVVASSIALGLLVDGILAGAEISVTQPLGSSGELFPDSVSLAVALLLPLLAIKPLRRAAMRLVRRDAGERRLAPTRQEPSTTNDTNPHE